MGDCDHEILETGGEENLIAAAAKQITMALGSKKNLTADTKKILADLGFQLSAISIAGISEDKANGSSDPEDGMSDLEGELYVIQEKIMRWETDQSMIWDSGPEEVDQYLKAADDARRLIEKLETFSLNTDDEKKEVLGKAHDILQMAMARLEEEFKHILFLNRQSFEPEHVSFRSEEDPSDVASVISLGDESFGDSSRRDSLSRNSEDLIIDLVLPDVIPDLRCIANLMFISDYGHECSQAYISMRRDALDECLYILEMEKLSIEDVLKLEWGSFNSKVKRWIRAMKIFVRVYLASEKGLGEQILGELGTVNSACFVDASKAPMLQLLNFAEAVSIGPHKPEKLIPILDIYEVLDDLLPDIDSLYSDEAGSRVRTDCREVLRRLGESVRSAFSDFENAIATNTTTSPFPGGGIPHLTRYVMNFLSLLTDYRETLNFLLKDHCGEGTSSLSPDRSLSMDEDNTSRETVEVSPLSHHFRAVASILECNLDDKAKLYKDPSLQHIFLMNNIHYLANKVKSSTNLRTIFGDDWIRKRNWKFQQHEMNYERSTWSSILSLLKDEGNSTSKTLLKEKFRSFYAAFEEVYRTQTAWVIPDLQLREDLRISTSLKVIQAYRTFIGRHANSLSDKQFKYTADDLEDYLLDLFEGSPKSLHNPHRR